MESKTKFMGHPVHPMLIVFPLGLLIASVVFDIAYFISGNTFFSAAAYYNIIGGMVMGLVAALFGFNDWRHIPSGTRAKSIGGYHGIGNVVIVALFFVSFLIRRGAADYVPSTFAFLLSLVAILLGTVTAWLGGEMVDRLGVGVDRGANLNAPSSLSGQPASFTGDMQVPAVVPVTGGEKYQEKHIEKHTPIDSDLDPKMGPDVDADMPDMMDDRDRS